MSTVLYCFSATGNSLTTARILADKLGDCRIVPVASVLGKSRIIEESDTVGFVFPVYFTGMPWPVRELISKMVFKPDTYIFTFTTHRSDRPGDAAAKTDQLLRTRGQRLSFAGDIPMPGNSFLNEPEVDERYLENQLANIEKQVAAIASREVRDYFTDTVFPARPVDHLNNFRGIKADESCIGCGTCVEVCPMNNIVIEDGRAVIGDDCSNCLACFHWCPVEAVYMSEAGDLARRKKYHHPDVALEEIIAQKK